MQVIKNENKKHNKTGVNRNEHNEIEKQTVLLTQILRWLTVFMNRINTFYYEQNT